MAKTERRVVGDVGEGVARTYLEKQGFFVVEQNHLRPWGEIDIVATKNGRLYFFEVKTVTREPRSGGGFRPEDNMHGSKIKRLQRVIQTYLLQSKRFSNTAWQLDLLCVYLNLTSRKARVERLENVIL
jgi:putative endonuclease